MGLSWLQLQHEYLGTGSNEKGWERRESQGLNQQSVSSGLPVADFSQFSSSQVALPSQVLSISPPYLSPPWYRFLIYSGFHQLAVTATKCKLHESRGEQWLHVCSLVSSTWNVIHVIAWIWNVQHRLKCGIIWEDDRNFRKWGLAEGSRPLQACS